MIDFRKRSLKQIADDLNISYELRKIIEDKIHFISKHVQEITNNKNFYLTCVSNIPELSTSDFFIEGFDETDIFVPTSSRIKVFTGGIDSSGEDLEEYKCILYKKKLFYYLVLGAV